MPKLEESQNDEFTSLPEKPKAYYGGALGDQGKTSVIPEDLISAKIIQRPGRPADTGVYLAPKTIHSILIILLVIYILVIIPLNISCIITVSQYIGESSQPCCL